MNINQYMCNMKVLTGLVLVNSIGLYIYLHHSPPRIVGKIDISDINPLMNYPLMNFYLTIYPRDTNINTNIVYNSEYIYIQSFGLGGKLYVFLP